MGFFNEKVVTVGVYSDHNFCQCKIAQTWLSRRQDGYTDTNEFDICSEVINCDGNNSKACVMLTPNS